MVRGLAHLARAAHACRIKKGSCLKCFGTDSARWSARQIRGQGNCYLMMRPLLPGMREFHAASLTSKRASEAFACMQWSCLPGRLLSRLLHVQEDACTWLQDAEHGGGPDDRMPLNAEGLSTRSAQSSGSTQQGSLNGAQRGDRRRSSSYGRVRPIRSSISETRHKTLPNACGRIVSVCLLPVAFALLEAV